MFCKKVSLEILHLGGSPVSSLGHSLGQERNRNDQALMIMMFKEPKGCTPESAEAPRVGLAERNGKKQGDQKEKKFL